VADTLTLTAGALSLTLGPRAGGSILSFRHGATALMRESGPGAAAAADGLQTACYPLAPYSNRIARGRFAFDGAAHGLARNFGDHPHPLHGVGWRRPWTVDQADAAVALLSLDHDPARDGPSGWPFACRMTQRFALDPAGLSATIAIENRDARPFPAGLGLHPFFPVPPGATLRFAATGVWLNGLDALPSALVSPSPAWDFAAPRHPGASGLDNCFAGWDGRAEIARPDAGLMLRIEADPPLRHLVVYAPAPGDVVAVEPVSHMTDAVNRMGAVPGHGLRVLGPGERLEASVRFAVGPLP